MLRPFAHPVACCWMLLRVAAQSLKPVKLLAPCKRTRHCWELLRPFARNLMSKKLPKGASFSINVHVYLPGSMKAGLANFLKFLQVAVDRISRISI